MPLHNTCGIVLLNGDACGQILIPANIGDAETTGTKGTTDQVAVIEDRTRRQMVEIGGIAPRCKTAAGAGFTLRNGCHTVGTELFIQGSTPPHAHLHGDE